VEKISTSDRLPLSPTRSPKDGFVWWQSLLLVLLLLFALLIPSTIALAFMVVFGWAHLTDLKSLTWPILVSQFVAYAGGLAVLVPLLPRLAGRSWRALGITALRRRDVIYAAIGAVVMVLFVEATGAAQDALFHLKPDEVQVQWLRAARGPLVGMFVFLACFAAPFFEELTFRGFLFNALHRYLPLWAAVVVSAFIFGGSHWQPGNGGAIVPLAAGGVVLALVYVRTRSLIASMLTHALFNLVTVVFVLVFHQS
jgi:membrane protease YdiL (CAAX protease family)